MRVLFVGPSLSGGDVDLRGLDVRAPARQGDLHRATCEGASVIGLVDGYFGEAASVWHKEVLFALSRGVRVLGASSLGALRAAECASYGMEPVGAIALAYLRGRLVDDDAVALLHGPAEMDYMPLTEPLVDSLATIGRLWRQGHISSSERRALESAARDLHFTRRDVAAIVAHAGVDPSRSVALEALYAAHRVSQKRKDALLLVRRLLAARAERVAPPAGWRFAETPVWKAAFQPA